MTFHDSRCLPSPTDPVGQNTPDRPSSGAAQGHGDIDICSPRRDFPLGDDIYTALENKVQDVVEELTSDDHRCHCHHTCSSETGNGTTQNDLP